MRTLLLQQYYQSKEYEEKLDLRIKALQECEEHPERIIQYVVDRWSPNPIEFVEQFGVIINPKFNNEIKPFFLFQYQKDILRKIWETEASGEDATILVDKVREMGLTWLLVWYVIWRWLFTQNWSALILSRKEELVDDGTSDPSKSIFGKIRWSMQYLPEWLMPEGFEPKGKKGNQTDSNMKLFNPQMQSILRGETANENAGRGGRTSFVFFDECFFVQNFNAINNAVGSSSNCKVYVSTSKTGRQFESFVKMIDVRGNHVSLNWDLNPFKDKEWYEKKVEEAASDTTGEAMKEIQISYAVPSNSKYYPEVMLSRVDSIDYDRKLPLYVSLDYGRQDHTVLIWWQYVGNQFNCIECIAKNQVDFDWFVPFMNRDTEYNPERFSEYYTRILNRTRAWKHPRAFFGESAHKQIHYPSNKSIQMQLSTYGVKLIMNDQATTHEVRRKATCLGLPHTVFNKDSHGVMSLYDAIENSRYAGAVKSSSKEASMKPAHDDETGDYRAACENFFTNSPRIIRGRDPDSMSVEERDFSAMLLKSLK